MLEKKATRLYFIDAMRAWAILMMLQGHFIDGLLDNAFRDPESAVFNIWKYFRGITAPVFFTVSGFIFTYLLIRVPQKGLENPRIKKGLKRGLQLLIIAYLLRLNLFGLLRGRLYESFFLVDVLHCIGLSIIAIIAIYLLTYKAKKILFPLVLVGVSVVLFLFEPAYKLWDLSYLPTAIANYLTKANGSVFTIIPWLGYTAFGGCLAGLFTHYKDAKNLYAFAIPIAFLFGLSLIFFSSDLFILISEWTGIQLFEAIALNNYLFIRLGDVLVVFALFMIFRENLKNKTFLRIGQNTLSIYVIHFIILYGSFTGMGLYYYFNHALTPTIAITGAILFMVLCSLLALFYDTHEEKIKAALNKIPSNFWNVLAPGYNGLQRTLKNFILRVQRMFGVVKH